MEKVVLLKCFGKYFLKPCFLLVCILAGFASVRRVIDEHIPLKAFFLQLTQQLSFLQNFSLSFTVRKLFKGLCILNTRPYIISNQVTIRNQKYLCPPLKEAKKKYNKTLRSVHFGVMVVKLIHCKCRGIVRNEIW